MIVPGTPRLTLSTLPAVNVTNLPDGSVVYLTDVEDHYVLTKTGAFVADGVAVIAPTTGTGYWVATEYGRWDDLRETPSQGIGVAALTAEVFADTSFQMEFFRHDQDDALSFAFQMPHDWNRDTAARASVVPHLHVIPMVQPAAPEVAYFGYEYAWALYLESVPAAAGWTAGNFSLTVPATGVLRPHMIASAGLIAPPKAGVSAAFLWRVWRFGTSGSDTFSTNKAVPPGTAQANLAFLFADLHYRKGSHGTTAEYG